jgi:hypothetical protein
MSRSKLPDKEFEWTPDLAYAIGLLVTDGCLSNDGRHITMRSSDIQLLETFIKCLNLDNKIGQVMHNGWATKPHYRVQFGNVQLYRWLEKIGLSSAKTYTISKLKIPDKYFRDFVRGHIDGDGSIITYTDKWNTFKNPKYIYTRLYVKLISASEKHIFWVREKIDKQLGIKGHTWERKPDRDFQTTSMWGVNYAKKDSLKLLSWIYYNSDVPCLKRKRAIAEKFM